MPPIRVRPFVRADRDQVTVVVNAHIAAVVPNVSVSTQELLSQLERQPGEFIVDRWVAERATLVAEQRGRVVAAAHLLRYGSDEDVSDGYRGVAEIRWLVCWPPAPYWPDSADAGAALVDGCLRQLDRWGADRYFADGTLPAPGVYGVPEPWPHIHALYRGAGFTDDGRTETVYLAPVAGLPDGGRAPLPGMRPGRSVGVNGTRISAIRGAQVLGHIEVDTALGGGSRMPRLSGWADVGNLHVTEPYRRRGVGTWLVAQAADWLRLGGVDRLLDYADSADTGYAAFLSGLGFTALARTHRGLTKLP